MSLLSTRVVAAALPTDADNLHAADTRRQMAAGRYGDGCMANERNTVNARLSDRLFASELEGFNAAPDALISSRLREPAPPRRP
jgi:hypothetical protein